MGRLTVREPRASEKALALRGALKASEKGEKTASAHLTRPPPRAFQTERNKNASYLSTLPDTPSSDEHTRQNHVQKANKTLQYLVPIFMLVLLITLASDWSKDTCRILVMLNKWYNKPY